MAQFTLGSKDIMACLTSLKKNVADAIDWVGRNPRRMKIEVPDSLWHRQAGQEFRIVSSDNCDTPRIAIPGCRDQAISAERAKVEILLNVSKKMGSKGKGARRPKPGGASKSS